MTIEQQIITSAQAAVKELYGQEVPENLVQLQKTRSGFEGNLTLVVFPFLKISHKKPEDTAQDLGAYIKQNCEAIADFNVVKGFLNLVIDKKAWLSLLNEMNQNEKFGEKPVTENSPLVMIEYSSPNTNKPLHLGHVRNNLLGWSLAQIMEANGNKVVKTNIVNDRGIHICKSMLAWLKYGNGETPETSGKKGDHLIGDYYVAFDWHYRAEVAELKAKYIAEGMDEESAEKKAKEESPLIKEAHEMLVKWEQNDPEVRALWKKMNDWVYAGFDETYKALGVGFDKIYYESNTYLVGMKKVEEVVETHLGSTNVLSHIYARIRSILRKAAAEGITIPTTLSDEMPLNEKEIELIQKLNEFGAAVEQAGKDYSPSGIANYCYELTKAFNQFYHDYSILGADTENEKVVRLVLAQNVGKTLKNGMALLGIEVPERM